MVDSVAASDLRLTASTGHAGRKAQRNEAKGQNRDAERGAGGARGADPKDEEAGAGYRARKSTRPTHPAERRERPAVRAGAQAATFAHVAA
jgi:hypothetical protein